MEKQQRGKRRENLGLGEEGQRSALATRGGRNRREPREHCQVTMPSYWLVEGPVRPRRLQPQVGAFPSRGALAGPTHPPARQASVSLPGAGLTSSQTRERERARLWPGIAALPRQAPRSAWAGWAGSLGGGTTAPEEAIPQVLRSLDDGLASMGQVHHSSTHASPPWWHPAKPLSLSLPRAKLQHRGNEVAGSGCCGAREAPEPPSSRHGLWDPIDDDVDGLAAQDDFTRLGAQDPQRTPSACDVRSGHTHTNSSDNHAHARQASQGAATPVASRMAGMDEAPRGTRDNGRVIATWFVQWQASFSS